jgi:uncharacterized protein with HEPN domain
VKSIPPKQAAYLLDIFRSVKTILTYVAGQTHKEFLTDTKTQTVPCRWRSGGPAHARDARGVPNIPFHKIAGMRNRVVHDYGNVDFEIVWETIQTHLRGEA